MACNFDSDSESDFEGFDSFDITESELKHREQLERENETISSCESDSDMEREMFEGDNFSSESDIGMQSDSDEDFEEPVWRSDNFVNFEVPTFKGATGPKFPNDFDHENASQWDYLSLFLDFNILTTLVENTNKYADKKIEEEGLNREKVWLNDVTMREIKTFLGISILFGINNFPAYRNFWDSSPFLGNEGVKAAMSRKRYEEISRFLHVSDPANELEKGDPRHDRLAKVRPLLDHCARVFPLYSNSYEHQTIDEGELDFVTRNKNI